VSDIQLYYWHLWFNAVTDDVLGVHYLVRPDTVYFSKILSVNKIDIVICLSIVICHFLLIRFKVCVPKISDRIAKLVPNSSNLFLGSLFVQRHCILNNEMDRLNSNAVVGRRLSSSWYDDTKSKQY